MAPQTARPLFVLGCVGLWAYFLHSAPYTHQVILLAAIALVADYLFRIAKNQ